MLADSDQYRLSGRSSPSLSYFARQKSEAAVVYPFTRPQLNCGLLPDLPHNGGIGDFCIIGQEKCFAQDNRERLVTLEWQEQSAPSGV